MTFDLWHQHPPLHCRSLAVRCMAVTVRHQKQLQLYFFFFLEGNSVHFPFHSKCHFELKHIISSCFRRGLEGLSSLCSLLRLMVDLTKLRKEKSKVTPNKVSQQISNSAFFLNSVSFCFVDQIVTETLTEVVWSQQRCRAWEPRGNRGERRLTRKVPKS